MKKPNAKKNGFLKKLIKYPIFFIFFAVLSRAKSGLDYEPASIAFFSSLVFSGENLVVLAPVYFAAAAVGGASFANLFSAALPAAVFIPLYYVCYKIKRKPPVFSICFAAALCRLPVLFFSHGDGGALVKAALTVLLAAFFTYAFCVLSRALSVRRVKRYEGGFSADERAALYLLFSVFFLGLYAFEFLGSKGVFYAAAAFLICFFLHTGGVSRGAHTAFYAAAAAGIGAAFFDADMFPLACLVVMAAAGAFVRPVSVYLSAFAVFFAFFIQAGVMNGFSELNIIENCAVLIGSASAAAIPKKAALSLSSVMFGDGKKDAPERSMVNGCRLAASLKTEGLYRAFADITSLILRMAEDGDEKKILMAAQFGGVAEIFKKLSLERSGVSFERDFERSISESLDAAGIPCLGAAICGEGENIDVFVVVNELDACNPALIKTVGGAVGQKLTAAYADIPYKGAAAVGLKAANRFDVIYGEASLARERVNGDAKSAMKVGGDKFIAALSDGMGHGEKAGRLSENAIGLIENFYRAGFTDDALLYLVNRLLCGVNDGGFATLDMCVIDLKNGAANFIKMGSHDGYIRRKGQAEIIESRALPLGTSDAATPVASEKTLLPDDLVVMVSDGVGEAFDGDGLKNLVAASKTKNPQLLADLIMSKAVENGVRDDLSVIVLRIFEKIN
ncbi:MAG: SpoIIE family protein phosphatase [Clostridiales bacterium]|jgi:serine/threonine protein phosphatase PrpC|nr:SpoIIE family protein phosphatase [Clostridiales bacterium]